MSQRKALDTLAVATMLVLCVLWGLQQVAVKLALPSMGAVMQIGLRSLAAAVLVLALIVWKGERLSVRDRFFLPGIGAGVLFALEFLFVAVGLQYTTASHMSVFLYTAPIFTVLGLHWLIPGERLGRLQWAGAVAAFAGIAVAFSNGFASPSRDWAAMLAGDALGVLGGLFWAATTLLIRRSALSEAPPAITLFYQLASCGVILVAIAYAMGQGSGVTMTPTVWGSLFFQAVIVAFLSYLVWFWMLRKYLASRLSVFSFLTPLFGVAFGVLLLGDPLDPRFVAGALLVMLGVVMVNIRR
ncbi:DMT family transporter [Noviherbaspirillum sp.]|uniref:DMT family transporter n=1 Tax=Noviherbaspirillum sp. TaxID=1926288 RepID=UPI002D31E521|nr:DMT family transporter [Noviherbaspirillum sp.]HZW19822.1 DMT family transporter [Noviherbaspirillum sp.]